MTCQHEKKYKLHGTFKNNVILLATQTGITTTNRCAAVRDTGVSQHHGNLINMHLSRQADNIISNSGIRINIPTKIFHKSIKFSTEVIID